MGYCVIFTQTLKQWNTTEAFKRALPEDRGTVFYPCVELWMGSLGRTVIEPLFPGYVFIRSDMDRKEVHEFIRKNRRELLSFVKELWVSEKRGAGEYAFDDNDLMIDLTDDEAAFLDFMFGFSYEAGSDLKSDDPDSPIINRRHPKIPEIGVLAMSYGYKEKDGRCVVVDGPLMGYEDRIVDTNVRDRRAYLNIKIGSKYARAGLTIRGKKFWFPNDREAPDILDDGTEIDCNNLANMMMSSKG